jgi:hypothetical protein
MVLMLMMQLMRLLLVQEREVVHAEREAEAEMGTLQAVESLRLTQRARDRQG